MKPVPKLLVLTSCLLLAQLVFSQSKALTKQIAEFDAYTEKAIKQWNGVGFAVTVIKDNEIIFKKGYGLRELNTNDRVDTNTLFSCGSTTKAMIAACMGILVDEGKVNWTDPVIKYLPEFQLHDPFVTRELTIKDLFLHNGGVGNTDFLWSFMHIESKEVLDRMRLVEPSYSFRSGFIYQNIFYLAAGMVIEKITNQSWDKFIRQRIFEPLRMTRTVPLLRDINDDNKTKPHMQVNGKMEVIEDLSADAIGPAGSVWSSIDDMGKWTKCMLDSGKYPGGRIIKPETWMEIMKVHTIVPRSEFYPTAQITKPNWTTYGLGWFQHDYKGRKVNFHTGSLPGSIAIHGQIPEERIAIYVFGNTDHVEVRQALMYKAFDLFALGGSRDWSTEFFKLYTNLKKVGDDAQMAMEKQRVAGTQPSLPLEQYAGKYPDPLYGTVEASLNNGSLLLNINNAAKASVSHWHYDTFRGPFEQAWYGHLTVQFQLGADGKVKSMDIGGMTFEKIE